MFYYNYVNLCNKRGISPSAAAEEMGFYRSDVTRWSKGVNPRQATLQKIADYFDVSVAELTAEEKTEKPAPVFEGGHSAAARELLAATEDFSPEENQALLDFVSFLKSKRTPK